MTQEEIKRQQLLEYTYHFYFHDGLFYYLEYLRDYLDTIQTCFEEKLSSKEVDEDESYSEHPLFDTNLQLKELFPDLLWRTTFLHCYFLFESSLDEIARNLQKVENPNVSLNDMSGKGIHRASLYLRKVFQIAAPFESNAWNLLVKFGRVRNVFVHSDGNTDIANKEVRNLVAELKGLRCEESFDGEVLSLIISREFTYNALETVIEFYRELSNSIHPRNRGDS